MEKETQDNAMTLASKQLPDGGNGWTFTSKTKKDGRQVMYATSPGGTRFVFDGEWRPTISLR